MNTSPIRRFRNCFSTLFGVAALCVAATSAEAQPVPVTTCRVTSSVTDPAVLSGCTDVVGDVHIEHSNAETLKTLSALRRVTGTLFITENPSLTSLEGLSNLSSVGGLVVSRNPALESIEDLDRLQHAPYFEVEGNRALDVLSGPDALEHVDALIVRENALSRLTGFRRLVSAGTVVLAKDVRLIYTPGLSRLLTIDNLILTDNPRLAPVTGVFRRLVTVRKELLVKHCPGIQRGDLHRDG